MKKGSFLFFVVVLLTVGTRSVFAATITVTTTDGLASPDGECSLREAVGNAASDADTTSGDCAAGSGTDTIEFNIPGAGPHTIELNFQLSLNSNLIIDGTTQPGTVCDLADGGRELMINIDGSGISTSSNVLDIGPGQDHVTVKGLAIYGNTAGSGITTWGDYTTIQCTNIGTDTIGTDPYPNQNGISIYNLDSVGHVIGGPNPGDGNLIVANGLPGEMFDGSGISGQGSDMLIQGNLIGVDVSGNNKVGNEGPGVSLFTTGGAGNNIQILDNIVSANGNDEDNFITGITIGSGSDNGSSPVITDVVIQGNIVGLNHSGDDTFANQDGGIWIGSSVSDVQIGGTGAGEGNVISGNGGPGISLSYEVSNVVVEGNLIGLNAAGNEAIVNIGDGIQIFDVNTEDTQVSNITIGGSTAAARNVIVGKDGFGDAAISVVGQNVTISGNYIGTDSTGLVCLGGEVGIDIEGGSDGVIVGGDSPDYGNVIGCNSENGIQVYGSNVTVQNNKIGVGSDNATDLPNEDNGLEFIGTSSDEMLVEENTIVNSGGSGIAINSSGGPMVLIRDNTIAGNRFGISASSVDEPYPSVSISQNAIYHNDEMGIDLYYNEGDTPVGYEIPNQNDEGDVDEGVNELLNYPVILTTVQDGSDTIVTYSLDVPVSVNPYLIEFFTNPTDGVDENGYGEGELYETSENKTISTPGTHVFTKTLANVSLDDGIIATTTRCLDAMCDELDGTSEFSNSAPPGVDYGTAVGSQTFADDDGAAHIINTVYLGACVNGDSGDEVNTDFDGPSQMGAYLGALPCSDDRDGVLFVEGELTMLPGDVSDTQFIPSEDGQLDDVVFGGGYTGDAAPAEVYLLFSSLSPDNGLAADEFIIFFNEEFLGPYSVTAGIPVPLFDGLTVTITNATGHQIYDLDENDGPLWVVEIGEPTIGLSDDTVRTDPYEPLEEVSAKIEASDGGYLHVWIDANDDGDFSDAGEHVVDNQPVLAGDNNAAVFDAPSQVGVFDVRFRYSSYDSPDLSPGGLAADGEVEDYQITVVDTPTPTPAPTVRRSSGGRSSNYRKSFLSKPTLSMLASSENTSLPLNGNLCPANLLISDSMKVGDRDGRIGAYSRKMVTQVALLQSHINRILASQYNMAAGPVDGIFGPLTKQGVMRLQTALNAVLKPVPPLVIDGIVGPFTKNAINHSCTNKPV